MLCLVGADGAYAGGGPYPNGSSVAIFVVLVFGKRQPFPNHSGFNTHAFNTHAVCPRKLSPLGWFRVSRFPCLIPFFQDVVAR